MKIIAGKDIFETLDKFYKALDPEATAVDVDSPYSQSDLRQHSMGIDEALKIAHLGTPVVMIGWQPPIAYAEKQKWHAALAYPNVSFIRHPALPEEMAAAIEEAKAAKRPADPLALQLFKVRTPENTLGVLHHDIEGALREGGQRKERWLKRARVLFGNIPEEEIISLVQNRTDPENGPLAGQAFPDVCVDVEGTLVGKDGQIRVEVLEKVTQLSKTHPVTVWTGGNLEDMEKVIRKAGIPWKIAPKPILRGAKVAIIIDDLEQTEFGRQYNVSCAEYIRV